MPHVTVQLLAGRTVDQKRACAEAITNAIVEHLNTTPDATSVVFQEVQRHDWASAGKLISDSS
ncbi:MAG: 4-oxalocrotonate tautomerase [Dehalococcoidia bacterium]|nr:4-oxalocrotonate tautomerase [Dehalococcoidia bacterium]